VFALDLDLNKREVDALKEKVIEVARELFESGLVLATLGVVSARIKGTDKIIITPSGFSKKKLSTKELIIVDLEGNVVEGDLKPSAETPMHTYIHKMRPDVGAVIHTHSPFATSWATADREIPCYTAEQAFELGGRVPIVLDYSGPATKEINDLKNIVKSLEHCSAALLRDHGAVVIGKDLEEALDNAFILEDVAKIAIYSNLIGRPEELRKEEIEKLWNFKLYKYGQR
jgi:L-ribulose-5-phosphate 4-epimerase